LFYVSLDDARIMRARVRITPAGLESDAPGVYAEIPVMPEGRSPFDVTRDGRLLLLERTISHSVPEMPNSSGADGFGSTQPHSPDRSTPKTARPRPTADSTAPTTSRCGLTSTSVSWILRALSSH